MNKRIFELAEQAEILFYKGRIPETGYEYEGAEVTKEDLEKFAELIVRECLRIVDENTYGPGDEYDYSYTNEKAAADDRAIEIYAEIKEYFGVSE